MAGTCQRDAKLGVMQDEVERLSQGIRGLSLLRERGALSQGAPLFYADIV